MRRAIIWFYVIIIISVAFNFKKIHAENLEIKKFDLIIQKAEQSSVSIFSTGRGVGFCSGVVIDEDIKNSYILSCKHCISTAEEVYVENNLVKYIFTTPFDDLAIFVVDRLNNKKPCILSNTPLKPSNIVFSVTFPDLNMELSSGIVKRITKDWVWLQMLVRGGCSGGGIFNTKGNLVGILWGGLKLKKSNMAIIEPQKDIERFLKLFNKTIWNLK